MTRRREPKQVPVQVKPKPRDQQGAALAGTCQRGRKDAGRCWGPFRKISDSFPMKKCKVCGRTS